MIDLNSPRFGERKFLSRDNILSFIDEYSIFSYYIGNFTVNRIMSSPFREDKRPSFGVFHSKSKKCLLFNDMSTGECGDCFALVYTFVQPTFTYFEAMAQVVTDFGLQDHFVLPRHNFTATRERVGVPVVYKESDKKSVNIRARTYTAEDYAFWNTFGISSNTLRKYNVVPVSHFFYGRRTFKADRYAYAYIEKKDNQTTYKIYQPFNKNIKFFSNMNSSIHAGYVQLPPAGDLLIITKSLKDVMSLVENTRYSAISVLSETVMIKDQVIKEYKNRFKYQCVFFDNDKTGLQMADNYSKVYDIPIVKVPMEFDKCKDFSDVIKHYQVERAVNMLEDELLSHVFFPVRDDLPF